VGEVQACLNGNPFQAGFQPKSEADHPAQQGKITAPRAGAFRTKKVRQILGRTKARRYFNELARFRAFFTVF
jgi:hypothetical protein